MTYIRIIYAILFLGLATLASTKPIIVSFGTNQGPIIPKEKSVPSVAPRSVPSDPAPVSEDPDDVPNPNIYKPLVPHQYRTRIYSKPPTPNLILGTPLDQRFTPSLNKFDIYQKQQARTTGIEYTGPHFFERQPYEFFEAQKLKTTLQPSVKYVKPQQYYQQDNSQGQKFVPQIGIIYSAGVRYYVPQIAYYNQESSEEQENSVYDQIDQKHFYRERTQ